MRNSTIDIARGIGILTVVLCHNWILYADEGELSNIVFSFHMPLFFFISGLFFKPNQAFEQLLTSKADSLLKPYFVVSIGIILVNFIFQLVKHQSYDMTKELAKTFYSSTMTLAWVQLWFLTHLFVIFIAAWVLYQAIFKFIKQPIMQYLVLFAILLLGTSTIAMFWGKPINPFGLNALLFDDPKLFMGLPFNLDITLVSTSFFLAGFFLSSHLLNFKFNAVLTAIMLTTFVGLHFMFNETIKLHARVYGDFTICTLQIISGIYLVFALSSLCSQVNWLNKTLAYLGEASLYILIFHFMPQHLITGILQYHFPQYNWPIAAFAFVASIVFSLVLWEITKKSRILQALMLPIKHKPA
jgi:polysaccharide biosynthesis protein PslL